MLTSSNVQGILTSYEIVKADADTKRQRIFYFDAFDVVKIIQGHLAYEYGTHFDKNTFIKSEDLLVHCFAGKRWLGDIYMLSPHVEEVISKIDRLFHAAHTMANNKPQLAINELLPELKLTTLMKSGTTQLERGKIQKYIESLKQDANVLFKLNSILELPTWFSRYKKLIRTEQTIKFDEESFDQANYWDKEEYKFILNAISQQRDDKRFGKNNEKDAQALTLIYQKLKQAERDPSRPIPVFFSSHPVLKKALHKIKESEPHFFTFRHKGEDIPIIRDASYFILYQIFNYHEENASAKFLSQMADLKAAVDRIFQNYKLRNSLSSSAYGYEHFESEIQSVVLNEFLNHVWLENDGIRILADEIENVIHLDKNQPLVEEQFKKERADFYQEFGKKIEIGRISTKLWNELPGALREFVIQYKDYTRQPDFDIFIYFGLMRFGLDKPIFEPIIQKRYEFIVNAVQKIELLDNKADQLAQEEINELRKSEHDLISEVSIMVAVLVQGLSTGQQDEDFVASLSILWLLEKYELIVEICDALDHNYDHYQIAFLHCAAINFCNTGKNDSAVEITKCIEGKLQKLEKHPYYNLWIGLAFTHFNIWYRGNNRPVLPEWSNISYNSPLNEHFCQAVDYLKFAISYLEETKDSDPEKQRQKNRKYYYALNNLIYYIAKGGTPEEFETIEGYVRDFRNYEGFPNIWQNRFYDTLAWYFLRKAMLDLQAGEKASFKFYLNLAAQKNESSMVYLFSKRERLSYLQLKEHIEELKIKNEDLFRMGA